MYRQSLKVRNCEGGKWTYSFNDLLTCPKVRNRREARRHAISTEYTSEVEKARAAATSLCETHKGKMSVSTVHVLV